jgi:putative transposase
MGRPLRVAEGGIVYHALNRANGRLGIFEDARDYDAFIRVLGEAVGRYGTRLLAYCVMPNHFHLMLWPQRDGELSRFMRWLTLTHTQRWHAHRQSAGSGHVYQGRFKSFPVSGDEHLAAACRYVERNALRANLVSRAEHWRWGSLAQHVEPLGDVPLLSSWPIERPSDWVERVNAVLSPPEEEALQRSLRRGCPFGPPVWRDEMVKRLGLESTERPIGRPRKPKNGS